MTLENPQAHSEFNDTFPENTSGATAMNNRVERRYDTLTSAAMIIALSSLITAGASVYMLIDSNQRNQEHTASIIAALKDQPISVPGTAGATNQMPGQAGASTVPSTGAAAAQQGGTAAAQQQSGGAAAQQGAQQGGSASAGQQPAQQGASAPVPSPELLLQTTMAAAEPGVPGTQLATKTVDGPAAAATLERVAEVRSKMAPPPGMEHMGDVVNFQIKDVVVNNDTATATLIIVWPAGWGEWTYPESGYQYVDGEWKLQKSTVCNLAAAAWVDCY